MTALVPMSAEYFARYLQQATGEYAKDNVRAGRWPEAKALDCAQRSFQGSLPQGLATADNYLFEIKAESAGATVGHLWFAVVESLGLRSAFVYDIEIKSACQRQGHAVAAFKLLETKVLELGLDSIGLHVFAFNESALALYRKLGFDVSSINMHKQLVADN